jgi:hypothetical protein
VGNTPASALDHDVPEVAVAEVHESARADSAGDGGEEALDKLGQSGPYLGLRERGANEAHPTVDVESDAPRRNDAGVCPEGGDAPDREAIAPVPVRQAQGGPDDAGKAGDIGDLLEDPSSIWARRCSEA